MFKNTKFILENPYIILFSFFLIVSAGIFSWFNLTIDAFPDVTNQQVIILTEAPGFSPDEVERKITFPLENSLGGLPGIQSIRSLSQTGLSRITVVFDDEVETYFARNLVFQRVSDGQG